MKITTVIYDMDGLLINSEPIWKQAEIELFKTVDIQLTEALCAQTMGYRIDEVIEYWYEKHPWENISKKGLENSIVNRVQELILENDIVLPGVSESIAYFKSKNLNLAIASSSFMRLIKTGVSKIGHEADFDFLHSAEYEDFGKPHPAVYLAVAKHFNVAPESCIVLEDSFYGMVAGLAAKMSVIAVPENSSDQKFSAANKTLASLLDIRKIENDFDWT